MLNSRESENAEVNYSHPGSTLANNPGGYHSIQYPSTLNSALGSVYDDIPGFLSLSTNEGEGTSRSALGFGNSESVPSIPTDAPTAFDYDYGYDDLSSFSIDDYLNIPSDPIATTSAGVPASIYGPMPPPISIPTSLSSSQPSSSPDHSVSSSAPVSSGTSFLVGNHAESTFWPRAPAPKLEIPPSSSFECPTCPRTFAFKSQLSKHMGTHNTVLCTFEGCKSVFKNLRSRDRHVDSCHKAKEPETCAICLRSDFYRKDKYNEHMKKCGKKRKRM